MKTLLLLLLICSCGKREIGGEKSDYQSACYTREEIRALCYVDEMTKLGHDPSMDEWVKKQCMLMYPTQGCYHQLY